MTGRTFAWESEAAAGARSAGLEERLERSVASSPRSGG